MYKEMWGLTDKPFQNVPDTKFLYYSSTHEEALVRLLYCITESKGLMLLIGPWGAGKTFTCRVFREKVKEKGYEVEILHPPPTTVDDLLQGISHAFQFDGKAESRFEIYRELEDHARRLSREGREMVLIIDEAQFIRDETVFEEIRLLLNITQGGRFLVNVILVGVPELWQKVRKVEGLRQRIGISFGLDALSREETEEYIRHRLKIAGLNHNIFPAESMELIFNETRGIPGRVNTLCDLSMLIATGEGRDEIDAEVVQQAVNEMTGGKSADMPEGE
jgi:general secretion pathway protein A